MAQVTSQTAFTQEMEERPQAAARAERPRRPRTVLREEARGYTATEKELKCRQLPQAFRAMRELVREKNAPLHAAQVDARNAAQPSRRYAREKVAAAHAKGGTRNEECRTAGMRRTTSSIEGMPQPPKPLRYSAHISPTEHAERLRLPRQTRHPPAAGICSLSASPVLAVRARRRRLSPSKRTVR